MIRGSKEGFFRRYMERRSPNDGALAYSNEDSQATSTEKLSEQLNDEDVLHALVGNVAYVWRQDAVDQWDRIERECHTRDCCELSVS